MPTATCMVFGKPERNNKKKKKKKTVKPSKPEGFTQLKVKLF